MLQMRPIPVPEWAKPFALIVTRGFGDQEYKRFSAQHDTLWERVQNAVAQYVEDDQKTAQGSEWAETEEEDFVPDRTKLSGEYYVSWEYYHSVRATYPKLGLFRRRQPAERFYSVNVMVHLLGTPQTASQTAFDYLGLNIGFTWHPKHQTLSQVVQIAPTQLQPDLA